LAIELSLYGASAGCRERAAQTRTSLICRGRTGSRSHAMARCRPGVKRARSEASGVPAWPWKTLRAWPQPVGGRQRTAQPVVYTHDSRGMRLGAAASVGCPEQEPRLRSAAVESAWFLKTPARTGVDRLSVAKPVPKRVLPGKQSLANVPEGRTLHTRLLKPW